MMRAGTSLSILLLAGCAGLDSRPGVFEKVLAGAIAIAHGFSGGEAVPPRDLDDALRCIAP